jgi:sugar lactone lactonase YvrE
MTITATMGVARAESVDFESDGWLLRGGQVLERDGRRCLTGFAYLDGVDIGSGVVEVDLFATGATSYPGIVFHLAGDRDFEWIYVRPHRAGRYPDAVQYSPTTNGIGSWQLCNGDGYTAPVELPDNEWVRLRLEFTGSQARLFVGDGEEPALHVKELWRGVSGGSVGLRAPADGSAFFSNFSYSADETLEFDPVPREDGSPGAITQWRISPAFQMDVVDLELPPDEQDVGEFAWEEVRSAPSGLLDIGRYRGRTGNLPDCVFATATLEAEEEKTLRLELGYSDAVSVFLNGRLLFTASNAYRQRDPTSLGIIGYHDAVYLPLVEGENEIAFIVTESFGGWGLMARDGDAVFAAEGVREAFETDGFLTPEAIVYDGGRDAVYVSNYDAYRRAGAAQYLSKLSPDGAVEELRWVEGLAMPTGMALVGSTLYVAERQALVEVDVESGEIVERHAIPGAAFPNDVAVDADGAVYVSDSAASVIRRFVDGEFTDWLSGEDVSGPNALLVHDGRLLFGNGGDSCLKSASLETGEVSTVARFRDGNIDGIALADDGSYLVSHWEGRVYRVTRDGSTERLLDTTTIGAKSADFGYDSGRERLLVPTFYTDQVVGYDLGG